VPPRSGKHLALGEALRSLRLEIKLSQEELGARAGLDRTYIGGIERGERNPSVESLLRVLKELETTPSELFRRAESNPRWR
jgi:transcriptional regulator with XRE-family HTH domain